MIVLDGKKLKKNLLEMEEIQEDVAGKEELKQLFLLLAGDKKTLRECSLEDIAYYFNQSYAILSQYHMTPILEEHYKKLEEYTGKKRRAL